MRRGDPHYAGAYVCSSLLAQPAPGASPRGLASIALEAKESESIPLIREHCKTRRDGVISKQKTPCAACIASPPTFLSAHSRNSETASSQLPLSSVPTHSPQSPPTLLSPHPLSSVPTHSPQSPPTLLSPHPASTPYSAVRPLASSQLRHAASDAAPLRISACRGAFRLRSPSCASTPFPFPSSSSLLRQAPAVPAPGSRQFLRPPSHRYDSPPVSSSLPSSQIPPECVQSTSTQFERLRTGRVTMHGPQVLSDLLAILGESKASQASTGRLEAVFQAARAHIRATRTRVSLSACSFSPSHSHPSLPTFFLSSPPLSPLLTSPPSPPLLTPGCHLQMPLEDPPALRQWPSRAAPQAPAIL